MLDIVLWHILIIKSCEPTSLQFSAPIPSAKVLSVPPLKGSLSLTILGLMYPNSTIISSRTISLLFSLENLQPEKLEITIPMIRIDI